MAFKLSFKILNRNRYNGTSEEINRLITNNLTTALNQHNIEVSRFYNPSRDSVKVLFTTEKALNKAMKKSELLRGAGFEPRMSIALKSSRTVYCHSFDTTLLTTYTENDIIERLREADWKVISIYILSSKKSLKIEMESSEEAKRFINNHNTEIGHIRIHKTSKELEVNPQVPQCWECGDLNPTHTSGNCMNRKRCLKCGSGNHQFFNCDIPKEIERMTSQQKDNRFCIPCNRRGEHTSLDHRQCPEKRKIVQDRVKAARDARQNEETENKRDTELIKKTIEITNTGAWPALQKYQDQQQKTSTIILLALLDEAKNHGCFQRKLDSELLKNGLPIVKYELEPNTAQSALDTLCATNFQRPVNQPTASGSGAPMAPIILRTFTNHDNPATGTQKTPAHLRHINDQNKHNKRIRNPNESSGSMNESIIGGIDPKRHCEGNQAIAMLQPITTSTANTGQITTAIESEPLNLYRSLREKIKSIPIHLSDNAKHLIPGGKNKGRGTITIDELISLINRNDIILSGNIKRDILKDAEIIQKGNCGDLEISANLNYSGPRTLNRMHEDSESEVDFY